MTKTTEQKFIVNAKVALVAILAKSLKTYKKFQYKKGLNKKAKIKVPKSKLKLYAKILKR